MNYTFVPGRSLLLSDGREPSQAAGGGAGKALHQHHTREKEAFSVSKRTKKSQTYSNEAVNKRPFKCVTARFKSVGNTQYALQKIPYISYLIQ